MLLREAGVTDFGELERIRAQVRTWATKATGDPDEAEDVAQVVLLRLHARLEQYQARGSFLGWLKRITWNVVRDRRRLARRRAELLAERATIDEVAEQTWLEVPAAPAIEVLARQALEALPERQRMVFIMCDLDGKDSREVGDLLGISPSTVRVHLVKARQSVRMRLLAANPRLLEEFRDALR